MIFIYPDTIDIKIRNVSDDPSVKKLRMEYTETDLTITNEMVEKMIPIMTALRRDDYDLSVEKVEHGIKAMLVGPPEQIYNFLTGEFLVRSEFQHVSLKELLENYAIGKMSKQIADKMTEASNKLCPDCGSPLQHTEETVIVNVGDTMKTISKPERFGKIKVIHPFKRFNEKDTTDIAIHTLFTLTMIDNGKDEEFLDSEIVPTDKKIVTIGDEVRVIAEKPERFGVLKEIRTAINIPRFLVTMTDNGQDEEWEEDHICPADYKFGGEK